DGTGDGNGDVHRHIIATLRIGGNSPHFPVQNLASTAAADGSGGHALAGVGIDGADKGDTRGQGVGHHHTRHGAIALIFEVDVVNGLLADDDVAAVRNINADVKVGGDGGGGIAVEVVAEVALVERKDAR